MKLEFTSIVLWVCLSATTCGSVLDGNGFSAENGAFYTDDAVVISAPVSRVRRDITNSTRNGKQLYLLRPRQVEEAFGLDCETTLGKRGTCKSFRDCYPLFKVADLSGFDGWVMGHYDTCSYISGDNMEVFGVCCTEPVGTPPQHEPDVQRLGMLSPAVPMQLPPIRSLSGFSSVLSALSPQWTQLQNVNFRQIPAQWPPTIPPLPTHPPDHTAATHPPSIIAGVTTKPPTSGTTWATKPPTTTKQTWPSMHPTLPSKPIHQPSTECGIKNGAQTYELQDEERIVGGHNADLNEWPWIVALFNGGRQFCGGSLIDDKHVLSAAHCVAHWERERTSLEKVEEGTFSELVRSLSQLSVGKKNARVRESMTSWDVARLTARFGDYNIRSNTETQHIERKIKRVVRHRGFDMRTLYNDVAVLTVDQSVPFSKNIRPICLPGGGKAYSGIVATVIGWGSLRESGPQPSILQEVSIPIWTNGECRQKYGAAAPGGIVEHMLCAGRASMDSCSGDSGGPLMVSEGGRWTQVGIVSWGIGCGKGQYPGVYTRVTAFLPWIQKNAK